ncbi:hypothetical protein BGZ63DRAFT_383297 [Mariannaea sp. PMI_226]|nr:hypothetical protein BGZ63DRAFT_383297 [Mariannaea sp. PMI_226]
MESRLCKAARGRADPIAKTIVRNIIYNDEEDVEFDPLLLVKRVVGATNSQDNGLDGLHGHGVVSMIDRVDSIVRR